jgi:hypothetical protein
MRMVPMSPNSLITMTCPLLNVPKRTFFFSILFGRSCSMQEITFARDDTVLILGMAPYNFISVQMGSFLSQLNSFDDLFTLRTVMTLGLIASVVGCTGLVVARVRRKMPPIVIWQHSNLALSIISSLDCSLINKFISRKTKLCLLVMCIIALIDLIWGTSWFDARHWWAVDADFKLIVIRWLRTNDSHVDALTFARCAQTVLVVLHLSNLSELDFSIESIRSFFITPIDSSNKWIGLCNEFETPSIRSQCKYKMNNTFKADFILYSTLIFTAKLYVLLQWSSQITARILSKQT